MTTKHTPGPWTCSQDETSLWFAIYDARNRELGSGDGGFEEADARLIAAAPDLLAALQTLAAEEYRDDDDEVLIAARDKARAAIAKATGA